MTVEPLYNLRYNHKEQRKVERNLNEIKKFTVIYRKEVYIMKRNETITKKQLNTYIAVMLIWGYLIYAVVTFFLGDYFMYHG